MNLYVQIMVVEFTASSESALFPQPVYIVGLPSIHLNATRGMNPVIIHVHTYLSAIFLQMPKAPANMTLSSVSFRLPQLPFAQDNMTSSALESLRLSDHVSTLRDTFKADLVQLAGFWENTCGRG